MKTQLGIDFSSIGSAKCDLKAVAKTDTKFVILRGTNGTTKDSTLAKLWKPLEDAGMVRGAYTLPVLVKGREPEPQMDIFHKTVLAAGGLRPGKDLPPALDVEFPKGIAATGMTRMECVDWVERAAHCLKEMFGCTPMLYTSARVWDGEDADSMDADQVPAPELIDCPLWLARYPFKYRLPAHWKPEERDGLKTPAVPRQLGDAQDVWIHQYQGDATGFPGIGRTVDLNRLLVTSQTGNRWSWSAKTQWIQTKIKAHGRDLTNVTLGLWDDTTERALREFQSMCGLTGDGVVGIRTFCALAWL